MSGTKKAAVLAYHSQIISGRSYRSNDHTAFAEDLQLLRRLKYRVVRAIDLVMALRAGQFDMLPTRCVALTLDDGAIFDFRDAELPPFGPQESMYSIARRAHRRFLGLAIGQPPVTFTSFVIASEVARREIAAGFGEEDWMTSDWWKQAQDSGYVDIGTHSWDHVHPSVTQVRERGLYVEAFHKIDDRAEADRQIVQAVRFVRSVTHSDASRLFAYPYGQWSEFLVREYLPRQELVLGAFTTVPAPVTADSSIWQIPRFVCNHHWKSPDDLRHLLSVTMA